jgi:hypothetical protein
MRYATDGAWPAHNEDDSSICTSKYTSVADLAGVFLTIPTSSASSERMWTRGARVLSLRRAGARLKDKFVSPMMCVKDNVKFLRKDYCVFCVGKAGNGTAFASFD